MIRLLTLSGIVLAAFQAQGQETQLPCSLTTAAKEGLQKIEEQKQHDIVFYAKNNKPQQETSSQATANETDFYRLYMKDEDNRYYNNYHDHNTDPIITAMPSPGPNLDYFFVDPCSNGNYDKVVRQ